MAFWVGTGWKMNKTRGEAAAYVHTLRMAADIGSLGARLFVLPPFTALAETAAGLGGSGVLAGAQNMHWARDGAWTGEISAAMISDCRASIVELGHSERRTHFNETDAAINAKTRAALAAGLMPLVCVGETAEERSLDAAATTVQRQTRMALSGVAPDDADRLLLAYEPVWAIGEGGTPATPEQAREIHEAIAEAASDLLGQRPAILYGGSVNRGNCEALARVGAIDGLFIGRSAWQAEGLLDIARAAVAARRKAGLMP
ncbi:MAG: triose-phosphate isomerase [Geminicoccaceae bacterium]|nr:triose-phosphate isomerase [Geminicoccaceae bacterium]